MIRPFAGIQTIAAASTPVFGTTITTAATTIAVDRYTGTNKPGTTTPAVTVNVTSSAGFLVNDRVQIGPKANFTTANRALLDHGVIASIVSATQITVQGLLQVHAVGEFCVLDEPASHVRILPVNTTAQLFLGTDSTVSSTDASVFDVIAQIASTAEPTYWHDSFPTDNSDSYFTSQYWISGTAGNTFVARFTQV